MSEQEKEEFRAQMRKRSGGRRPQGDDRSRNLSEEERARLKEQRESMRQRFENMSEEEKEEFSAQMRERSGGRRPQGDAEGSRRRQGARQQENNSE
jgi:DNA anti-recombination protein RmuC